MVTEKKQSLQNIKGCLILCFASLIWGVAFVAQAEAADKIPPFLLNSLRSFVSALFLFGFLLIRKTARGTPILPQTKETRKPWLQSGLLCGLLLTVSVNFQQFGLAAYPADVASEARAGFLTALYVILVPLLSILFGKRLRLILLPAVALALVGVYLLCLSDGLGSFHAGDALVLLCALSFSFHILTVDRFSESVDGVLLSATQFLVCGVFSGILFLIFETSTAAAIVSALPQILYLGILSGGVGYTLQIVGQRYAEPTVASLSMSLESVFAALGGWLISGNVLSGREWLGCGLVFAAIVLAQLPVRVFRKKSLKNSADRM